MAIQGDPEFVENTKDRVLMRNGDGVWYMPGFFEVMCPSRERVAGSLLTAIMVRAARELTEFEFAAFTRYYGSETSYRKVAEELGVYASKVQRGCARAARRLRESFSKEGLTAADCRALAEWLGVSGRTVRRQYGEHGQGSKRA